MQNDHLSMLIRCCQSTAITLEFTRAYVRQCSVTVSKKIRSALFDVRTFCLTGRNERTRESNLNETDCFTYSRKAYVSQLITLVSWLRSLLFDVCAQQSRIRCNLCCQRYFVHTHTHTNTHHANFH